MNALHLHQGKMNIILFETTRRSLAVAVECLVLGVVGDKKEVTLIEPERKVDNGTRIG